MSVRRPVKWGNSRQAQRVVERAADLQPTTEAQVVTQVRDALAKLGWYPVETEANLVKRGSGHSGKLPPGFPDHVFLKGRPDGTVLACVMELKRPKGGRYSARQEAVHQMLAQWGIKVHRVKTVQEAVNAVMESAG